ncbi:MAG: hypothetical protein ACOCXX_05405 [Planctomycetota bacterium]
MSEPEKKEGEGGREGGDMRDKFLPIRRLRLLMHLLLILGLLGLVTTHVVTYQHESEQLAAKLTWVYWLSFAVAFGSLITAIFIWKCPNCHKHIPPEFKNRCPHCGVLLR